MKSSMRLEKHRKNQKLEDALAHLSELLGPVENQVLEKHEKPEFPVFMLLGCARSGSTVLNQYLAHSGVFAYPSNLISRFYYAPYLGARIQQILSDFDFRNEILRSNNNESFSSDLGKTFGPLEPHEFWYFWDRFFKFGELQQLDEETIKQVDWDTFLRELHALEQVFSKPLLLKATKLGWHLSEFKARLNKVHFIHIKRDILYNAQSLLLARQAFFGNYDEWYSLKPESYFELKKLDPAEQVVLQVIHTNAATDRQLADLPEKNYSTFDYSDFCEDPDAILRCILQKADWPYSNSNLANNKITLSNRRQVDEETFEKLQHYVALHSS